MITTDDCRTSYAGNGSTTAFATGFQFMEAANLKVILVSSLGVETVKTLNTHYTVSGGASASGTVTMLTAPASGETLTIVNNIEATQELDLEEFGNMPSEALESALDRITLIAARAKDLAARSLRLPDGSTETGTILELPSVASRASKYLGFDASSVPVALGAPVDTAIVSSFMATVLDDANAPAAVTTLGFSSFFQTLIASANQAALNTLLGMSTYFQTLIGLTTKAAVFDAVSPTTTRGDLIRRGASANERVALGASGTFVQSDGTDTVFSGPPKFHIQIFAATADFTVPANVTSVKVTVIGGGGGGGGGQATTAGQSADAGGGGGGGAAIKVVTGLTPGATVTCTVGAGGTAAAAGANTGGTGGTSSFGAHCSATGGAGGSGGPNASGNFIAGGGNGGLGSSGDTNLNGSEGKRGLVAAGAATQSGSGGASIMGGSRTNVSATVGVAGLAFGGGGSGASLGPSLSAAAGGAGAAGGVIVEWIA